MHRQTAKDKSITSNSKNRIQADKVYTAANRIQTERDYRAANRIQTEVVYRAENRIQAEYSQTGYTELQT
jgi:hypothetical protein